ASPAIAAIGSDVEPGPTVDRRGWRRRLERHVGGKRGCADQRGECSNANQNLFHGRPRRKCNLPISWTTMASVAQIHEHKISFPNRFFPYVAVRTHLAVARFFTQRISGLSPPRLPRSLGQGAEREDFPNRR